MTERLERLNWAFVADRLGLIALLSWWLVFSGMLLWNVATGVLGGFGGDGILYYRATEAWVQGRDPWTVSVEQLRFAGIPPTLLLNLPLLPFGENAAGAFWPIAALAGWLYTMRRLGLPWYWLLFPAFVEGLPGGGPDPFLVALMFLGGGAIAALTKPYSIPAILAEGRWRAVVVAVAALLVSIPLLPWGQFFTDRQLIGQTITDQGRGVSAWGDPLLMILTSIALLSLGWRSALYLATPGLFPVGMPHYAVFSIREIARSKWLAFFLSLPVPGAAALGIIAYAVMRHAPALASAVAGRLWPRPRAAVA